MAKSQKILVPVDGSKNSQRGLDKAIELAKSNNGQVTGFYVFHFPVSAGMKSTKKMHEDAQNKAVKAVGPSIVRARKAGVSFDYKTDVGPIGPKIIKAAKNGKYDMIVIGARGLGGLKEKFLGSVSNHVMHESKIPVLVVK